MQQKKIFGFNRNIFYTGLTSLLTDISTKMAYSIMPIFLLSIGASKTTLSAIEGIAESTAALLKALSGFWSDKIGKNKPFMILGYGISAIVMPFYAFVASPIQVLYLRFIERTGKGIRTAPRDSLIAGCATNGDTGKSFGLQKMMDNAGAILGPLVAFSLLSAFPGDYRRVLLFAGIPAILAIFVLVFGIKEIKKPKEQLLRRFNFKDYPKRFYLFLGITFLFTLGNSTDALLMVKANDVGVKVAYIPLVYLIMSIVSVALAIPLGTLSDKIGKEKILVFGYLVYATVYYGFGATNSITMIAWLFALYGLYSAATDGIQKALVSDILDSNKIGTGLGLYNALLGITLLPASIIAGLLYDHVNSAIPFYFGAGTAILSAILMALFYTFSKKQLINSNLIL